MAIVPNIDLGSYVRQVSGENAYLCYQCQRCSSSCPASSAMQITPAQMMRMAQVGLEHRIVSDGSIWRCLGCDSCTQHCPHGVSVRRLVEVMRGKTMQDYYLAGETDSFTQQDDLRPGLDKLNALSERVLAFHNVSGEDNSSRLTWTGNLANGAQGLDAAPGVETVYFVGCVSAMFPMTYGIPQSFATILSKSGQSFTTLGAGEWCCGYPMLMAGQFAQAEETMRHNVEQMRLTGAKRLVTTCPSCYHMWKHIYPEHVGSLDFDVVTSSELLGELVQAGSIRFAEPQRGAVVTYHDPCDLGRKSGQYEQPRQVIRAIPGYTFVEMQSNREHALCCGGGGDLESFDPGLVTQISARRVAQAVEIGAEYLISACPQCVRTLSKAVRANKLRIRVMDLAQFVETALLP
ncbi:MAG: (Fe-S)-binding protein [Anaerolineae bacterium]